MKKILLTLAAVALSVSQVLAFSKPPAAPAAPVPVDPMFNTFVSMGDSLTHGFQGGAVDETRQPYTYGKRLSELMKTSYVQPLLKFPGFLVNIEDVGKGNIKWYEYYYAISGGKRVDDFANQSKLNNFGITGADITTALENDGGDGGYYKLVLGSNGAPMIDQALNRNPSFLSVWLGNNDALGCALWTDVSKLTDLAAFKAKYAALVSRITAKGSIQGVVVATVPDVAAIPYLQPANSPEVPAGSLKAFWNTNVSGRDEVLTPQDVATIRARTAQFNDTIISAALANGWGIMDANSYFVKVQKYGHNLKDKYGKPTGRIVNSNYLGGCFSLDGVHMSTTGYSIAANLFAEAINAAYNTKLGYVDEFATSEIDTLYKKPYDPRNLINSWIGQAVQWVVEMFI